MPWPLEKDFLLSLGIAEELPVMWASLKLCAECFHHAEANIVCPDCRCARYCTEECQTDHATAHAPVCPKLAQIQFAEWDDLDLKGPELVLEGDEDDNDADAGSSSTNTINNSSSSSSSSNDNNGTTNQTTTTTTTTATKSIHSEDIMLLTQQCLQNHVDPNELSIPDPPQTVRAAEERLQRFANTGHREAQFGMALVAAKQLREDESFEWTRLAAVQGGLADAQMRYAVHYWFDGAAQHRIDFIQAILWLRRALVQGRDGGLSEPAFLKATNLVRAMANEYYNTLNQLEMKQRGIGFQREMKLCAECGCIPAINMVWLVHSKGDWYETFFARVEAEKTATLQKKDSTVMSKKSPGSSKN